ncbi:hypothetical protein Bbelb_124560 [Branchiostoma belcheri]|nr:hypothetical protein Bbelb_124560 [Branchiostoma belcheri]
MAWRLDLYTDNTGSNIENRSKSWTLVVEVPKYSFCFAYDVDLREYSVEWIFHSSGNISYIPTSSFIRPGTCGERNLSFSKASIHPPIVVIATDVSPVRTQERSDMVDQCRQVWEHDKGVTVAVGDNSVIQLVSIGATATNVAMALGKKRITQTNATRDNTKNITCILFSKDNYTKLFFTTPRVETESQIDTDLTSHSHSNTTDESSGPRNKSPAPSTPENLHVLVSVAVPVVVLVSSGLVSVAVALKLRFHKVQYNRDTRRAAASSALPRRQTAVYGTDIEARGHRISIYGKEANANRQQRRQGLGRTHYTLLSASLPVTLPNTHWPWKIPGEGTGNTPRRVSLTLPNTYWPWDIPGEGTRNTPRRASLPTVTLPNTYWPWEIPGQGTHNTPRRASLPTVTLPNTYWPWEIPGQGTRNTPRRASLPTVTLPNTYWPWEIPGEGT